MPTSNIDRVSIAFVQITNEGYRVQMAKKGHHFELPEVSLEGDSAIATAAKALKNLCTAPQAEAAVIHCVIPAPDARQMVLIELIEGSELPPTSAIPLWRLASLDEVKYHLGPEWGNTLRKLQQAVSTL